MTHRTSGAQEVIPGETELAHRGTEHAQWQISRAVVRKDRSRTGRGIHPLAMRPTTTPGDLVTAEAALLLPHLAVRHGTATT